MATTELGIAHRQPQNASFLVRQLPYACVALCVALYALLPAPEGIWLYLPLLGSMLFLGLPHGAVDHMVLLQLENRPCTAPALARVIVPYLSLAGCYLGLWFLMPALSFAVFIFITWFHWGQGDVHTLFVFSRAAHLTSLTMRRLALVVRGGLPMLVPLLAFPDVYQEVFLSITARFDAASSAAIVWPFSNTFRWIAGFGFAGITAVYFGYGLYTSRWMPTRSYWEDLAEVMLLVALFVVVHPLVAIGIYFCCWHAVRHIVRVIVFATPVDAAYPVDQVGLKRGMRRFFLQALPTTLVALLGLGALQAVVPHTPTSMVDFTGLYLVLIAVLTLPHIWVVWRMDRVEGLWAVHHHNETVSPVPNSYA